MVSCYLLCIVFKIFRFRVMKLVGTVYLCLGLWSLGCAGFIGQMKQIPCALTELR